ncbi:MAG: ribbon-helix-helix protein, CopG family [Solirubrobacterales bacterium]|nr:ribbon-helix-helix protein, CopG family [Solirubrobacterales bacterium]MBA3861477.1 ribbon-helix-helix protein, CopG family [Solirubrobacterales bacterium]
MRRFQVQLTDEQARDVRSLARERGVSVSEIMRRGADEMIRLGGTTHRERMDRALGASGMISDAPDVGQRHDYYLAKIYGS